MLGMTHTNKFRNGLIFFTQNFYSTNVLFLKRYKLIQNVV